MKHKFTLNFRKMTLTQQVMALILMMLAFLSAFFFFFLSDNIDNTITGEIYNVMASKQQPIAKALETGKNEAEDPELLEYLSSDPYTTTGLSDGSRSIIISDGAGKISPELETFISDQAKALLAQPSFALEPMVEGTKSEDGEKIYYRLRRVNTPEGSVVIFSYMDSSYEGGMRRTILDSTIYVTVLAFFLILMIFVFWVFSIIHPLNQIKAYITQIKEGKDVDLWINRNDEIGEVANELRTLTSELAKQEKSKEEMIHNISHDLKTPIATIKSYSESIKDGIYPYGDLESSVDVILDNAQRLEDKVHNLLYMNRVEYLISSDASGVVTNMKDVVEQVVLNSAVVKPEIEIQTDVEEVFFDGLFEGWRVVVENIMENAFRYAKSYIRISVHENELLISNDGPKMKEDRIESLFKPYVMGEGGRFGLGLSIVSKVVAANKYKVEGMNTEDGVAFHIWRDVPKSKERRSAFKGTHGAASHWSADKGFGNWGKKDKDQAKDAGKDDGVVEAEVQETIITNTDETSRKMPDQNPDSRKDSSFADQQSDQTNDSKADHK